MRRLLMVVLISNLFIACSSSKNFQNENRINQHLKAFDDTNVDTLFKDKSNVNARVDNGIPLLGYFAKTGNLICINRLISLGANINPTDTRGFTSFIFSAYSNQKVMKL